MTTTAAEIARQLDLLGKQPLGGGTYNELHQSVVFFDASHYSQYVPTLGSEHLDYEARLVDWLMNVSNDDDRGLLLELAPRIVFLTRDDFAKLHAAALRGSVYQWIIRELHLTLDDPALEMKIQTELDDHIWFTSITDSMPISDFHHANRLGGIDHRPDWRSLAQFGDPLRIQDYMNTRKDARGQPKPIHRIVVLEDFVGSGTQMEMGSGSVDFAATNFPAVSILLVPLIICPEGARRSRDLAAAHPNVTFSPVLEITQDHLISPTTTTLAPGSFEDILRDACHRLYGTVEGNRASAPIPYSAWGFGDTGATIVLYSNCPANTLPIIQHESSSWRALFPRSARIR